MLDSQDWNGIAVLAAWIRECGDVDHGLIVEDDSDIYDYPLDEDGNYIDEYSEKDHVKMGVH